MVERQTGANFTTLDAYLAGFLVLRGFTPHLVSQQGKVVFCFEDSRKTQGAILEFHAGATVGASLFTAAVKALKGKVHDMRRDNGDGFSSARPHS
jgi:hypothetical protein